MIQKYKTELKWAINFMIMTLLWMMMERALGWHDELIHKQAIYTNFIAIPAIVIYFLALRDKKKTDYNGQMSYKEGFMSGIIISIIVAAFSPLTQIITSNIITPHYFNNVIAAVVKDGSMSQESAEAFFNLKSYIIQGLFGALVMGVITSAIVAYFVKSKPQQNN